MIASLMLDLCAATVLLLAGLGLWVCVSWMARRLMCALVMPRLWRRNMERELLDASAQKGVVFEIDPDESVQTARWIVRSVNFVAELGERLAAMQKARSAVGAGGSREIALYIESCRRLDVFLEQMPGKVVPSV